MCGGQLQTQGMQGWPGHVCRSCGSVTLEAQAARQIIGADAVPRGGTTDPGWRSASEPVLSNDTELQLHLEHLRAERQRRLTIALGLATSVVVLVLALPLSLVVYDTVRDRVAARELGEAPKLTEALPPPVSAPIVMPPVAPTLVAQAPEPEPEPVPVAPAEAPPPSSARALVRQGWNLADATPAAAADRFRRALELAPGDAEASYGLGYSALKQRDRATARRYLCAALPGADLEMRREIQALLAQNQLSCAS